MQSDSAFAMEDDIRPAKRFKHQSYQSTLKEVHFPSALNQTTLQTSDELADHDSHFASKLAHLRQLTLSRAFVTFANKADSLCASLPLLLLHHHEVIDLWLKATEDAKANGNGDEDDGGLKALLELMENLALDLRTTLLPSYAPILGATLSLLHRTIPAGTLTQLLTTLAAIWKYLLLPSLSFTEPSEALADDVQASPSKKRARPAGDQSELLERTWGILHAALADPARPCNPEVQRAVAEVWGSMLRRFKGAWRERALGLLADALAGENEDADDACAWVVIYACKSISQTLHTAAPAIVKGLLHRYVALEDGHAAEERLYTLLRRALTALVHHVKSAEQFVSVGELLCAEVTAAVPGETLHLRRTIKVATVPCAVRTGSRMSSDQLGTLVTALPNVPLADEIMLSFATALFFAGDLPLWTGPGRKALEHFWRTEPAFAIKLSGALADLGWGGGKMLLVPMVVKHAAAVLEAGGEAGRGMLRLLAAMRLGEGDVDLVWRQRVGSWADERLGNFEMEEGRVEELSDVLDVAELLPGAGVGSALVKIVEKTLETEEPEEEWRRGHANTAWVLRACMCALAERDVKEWATEVDVGRWVQTAMTKWGWSEVALEGAVALAKVCVFHPLPLETVLPALQGALMSHSRPLRLHTLRLLCSRAVAKPTPLADVLKRCLQGEEVSLDVQGVRERVLRIGRLGPVLKDGDEIGAEVCTRWLLSQLKVNLRPLWSPAAEALAQLSRRFDVIVWKLVFEELRAVATADYSDARPPAWARIEEYQEDDVNEEERSWRDPSAHKLRVAIKDWTDRPVVRQSIVESQIRKDRFDAVMYESQLLGALGVCPWLAEKHNRELVPMFLELSGSGSSSQLPRQKLVLWFTLFAKLTNPKALYATETLQALYMSLLSHPDRPLQTAALTCIMTYKPPHILPYQDTLTALLDDTRWRDTLAGFSIAYIEPQHRDELVQVVVRLLYGIMLEKKGRSRGADRRAAVLGALAGCTDEELGILVDLMVRPLQPARLAVMPGEECAVLPVPTGVTEKQQVGFLTLLGDVLKHLGSRLTERWPTLLGLTIDLVAHAQAKIDSSGTKEDEVEDHDEDEEEAEASSVPGTTKATRTARQLGLKRLGDFFRVPVQFDFAPYLPSAFVSFVSPRLPALDRENTQSPSSLLDLFYVWSTRPEYTPFLVAYDDRLLPQVYNCLVATNVKPAVIGRIFDVVESLLALSADDQTITETVLKPHVSLLLSNIATLMQRSKETAVVTDPLSQRQLGILSELAPFISDGAQASMLLLLVSPHLRKPTKTVNEKIKTNMLKIVDSLLPLVTELSEPEAPMSQKTHEMLSELFQSLRGRPARLALLAAFGRFALVDVSLKRVADLLGSLNAYSAKRLDEPDFDRRLSAFALLNDQMHSSMLAREWLPVIYNSLHFIQDPEELAVRSNAAFTLRRFIDYATEGSSPDLGKVFTRVLYPALRNGLRTKNEMVRAEVLSVLAYAIKVSPSTGVLNEMRPLLADGDDEANFFNNVLHIQLHRRTRALRRLAEFCDQAQVTSATVNDIFVPLVGHFITATAVTDHHLVNEAITTTGHMAAQLKWGAYHALVQQYLRLLKLKDEAERVYVRTLVAVLDNFHFPMDEVITEPLPVVDDGAPENDELLPSELEVPIAPRPGNTARIADAVTSRLLPNLLRHLETRDENEESGRVPVAVGIVKVAMHLPAASRGPQITRLLTILSQILRSKSQDTRDLVRDTLCRIAVMLGATYLPGMLQEMRTALLRGPQLHVLASVAHHLLVHVTSAANVATFDPLDACVAHFAHIFAEVIFGESGKDVQAEGFKTKLREVRSSTAKGLDSFALVAKYITPAKISSLLLPVKGIMQQTSSLKVMNQCEDVLRRIATGLNGNQHLVPTELLVLCHTLITQNARFLSESKQPPKSKRRDKRAIVDLKRKIIVDTDHYANNSFRFIVFGIDLFNTAFKRGRFDFHDAQVIARLEPMVAIIGNTLYSSNGPVLAQGLRASAAIVRCPLKSIDKSMPVFIRQIIEVLKQAGNTESDVAQNALKSLSTILRECPSAEVKEKDLVYLLELLSPDLEDPTRQTSVFTMLRAIVARKFVVPEIYDMMERVSDVMVTNQSAQVQELCRGVLLQFLLDYPQGKGRLRNQMTFLVKNLSYVYESGRKSVMELLGAVITKFDAALIQEYSDLLFVGLVMVIANDESSKCREIAAELIKSLFKRLDDEHRRVIVSHQHAWAAQRSNPRLNAVSMQVCGLILDVLHHDAAPHLPSFIEDMVSLLRLTDNVDASEDVEDSWQTPYHVLVVFGKIFRDFPHDADTVTAVPWGSITELLLFPHAWVRLSACRLLGLLFSLPADVLETCVIEDFSPLSDDGMKTTATKLCEQLKSEHLDAALSLQVVKNLFFIGRRFCGVPLPAATDVEMVEAPDDEPEQTGSNVVTNQHPLPWLFSRLSYQARSAHIARRNRSTSSDVWYHQPASILKWFAAMAAHMEASLLERFLVHILSPVYRIVDDDSIRDPHMDELKTLSVELQDLIQGKVGVTVFSAVYNQIRQGVMGVRRDRKTARVLQETTNPQFAARRKAVRNDNKKDSRKRKTASFRAANGDKKARTR